MRAVSVARWSALLLLTACGSTTEVSEFIPPPLVGADVSALERIEQAGGVFKDHGTTGDAIGILRANGANLFRLRLFVNPNYSEVQVNDLAYTVRMASRVKASGARLLLDIHYSDTWADPGHQQTPATWVTLPIDSLKLRVRVYTASVMAELKRHNDLPYIVQVGNEVDAGMLWPLGQLNFGTDSTAEWQRFTDLLKAGIQGVRDSLTPGDSVRIMLHYSQGASTGGTQWFFDHITALGVPYDVIGLSYYPWWHGTLSHLTTNLNATAQRYGKDVMIVEMSYPWRSGTWESMVTNQAAMTWPVSPAGQQQMMHDVANAVSAIPNGRGLGLVWWYPEAIEVPNLFVWGGGSLSLFDASGNLLPAGEL